MMDLSSPSVEPATRERGRPEPGAPLSIVLGLAGLQLGGCQINAIDLGRALRLRGHDVAVFAVRDDDVSVSVAPYAARAGFDIELMGDRTTTWQTARRITRIADRHEADVVHVFAPWLGRIVGVAAASWAGGRACVETNWNMENAFWGSPRVPLIVGTGAMQAEAQTRVAVAHLMEPPVDLGTDRPDPAAAAAFRVSHGIRPEEVVLTIVTRVDREMKGEGIVRAIAAVVALDRPGVRLVVVGDGDAYQDVARVASDANTRLGRPAVLLTGSMLDPRPAYAAADVVLGMGGSAIRALAHGKPLVVLGADGFALTYEATSLPHFRREGFYGTGSATDPVEHLTTLLDDLVADPARRAALGMFGLAEAESRFGLEAAATSLELIYRSAIDHAPPRLVRLHQAARLLTHEAVARTRSATRPRTR